MAKSLCTVPEPLMDALEQTDLVYHPWEEKESQEEEPSVGHLMRPEVGWQKWDAQRGCDFGYADDQDGEESFVFSSFPPWGQNHSVPALVLGWTYLLLDLPGYRGT